MMTLRIGCVQYINALPLHLPFQLNQLSSPGEFVFAIPQELNIMMQKKQLDVALTSSVEYFDHSHNFLPGFGIVGHNQVLSVNLYSKLLPKELKEARVGVTHHSATSIALLKVLCRELWHVSPNFEPLDRNNFSTHDAFLLIGDEALQKQTIPGFQKIDLAAAWYEMTHLPFVFALFSTQKDMIAPALQIAFDKALQWSEAHPEKIQEVALQKCKVPLPLLKQYYSVLGYRLGTKEMESLKLFRKLRSSV